ncbi:MAG TPA: HemK/PrmC family methyltransferase [Actinomycetota bacterium]|nr:HemK/PrmC family methyltransferase [Actinomycetota bacterium]
MSGGPFAIDDLLRAATRVLSDSTAIFEDHDNEAEARQLLAFTLGVDDEELDEAEPPSTRDRDRFLALVARRAAGEPFPFLIGKIDFYGLELKVWPGAFVPRPSSELTVNRSVARMRRKKNPVVVDVCAGAAPIALAIADELPRADVWALDISEEGLSQGRKNARRLGINNVSLRRGDLYAPLPARLAGQVDLITAHVPYVPAGEIEDLPEEVREHEPLDTLTDHSHDGLYLMRRVVEESREWLRPDGWLLLEMSDDVVSKARRLCRKAGFDHIELADDEDGLSVVVEARRSKS